MKLTYLPCVGPALIFAFVAMIAPTLAHAQTIYVGPDGAPVVHGVQKRYRRKAGLCLDYGATRFPDGQPYHVVEPSRTITRHEGMDFCRRAGSPVLAPVAGKIRFLEQDNRVYGGVVAITTEFSVRPRPGRASQRIFVEMVHIVPVAGLRVGQTVKAGQKIGEVQRANRPSIGSAPHVHFAVRRCNDWPTCHIDPNFFWRDGPGQLSCFDAKKDMPKGRIVAPVPCR